MSDPLDIRALPVTGPITSIESATLPELLAKTFPPPVWIVPETLPEGVTVLGGKAKMGKTYLGLSMGIAVALGGVALGRIPVEPRKVLYFALEDGEELLQDRVRQILAGAPPPVAFHYATVSPTMDNDGVAVLDEWLGRHDGVEFVVVDTLKRVRPRVQSRTRLYDEDYDALSILTDLAHRRRISILVLHHLTKVPSEADPFDELSGSMGLQAAPDTLMVLRGVRGQADAVLHVIGRRIAEQLDLALRRDGETGTWSLMGDAADYQLRQERQAILDAIEDFGEPMAPRDIAASLEKNPNTIRVLLRKMVRVGEIAAPVRGLYATSAMLGTETVNSVNSINSPGPAAAKAFDFWRQDAENGEPPRSPSTVYANFGVNSSVNSDFPQPDAENGLPVYGVYGCDDEREPDF